MKKLLTVILFTILYCSAFAQIHITTGDGQLEFDIPDNELVRADEWITDRIFLHILEYTKESSRTMLKSKFSPMLYEILQNDGFVFKKEHIVEMIRNNDFKKSGIYSVESNFREEYGKRVYKTSLINESYQTLYYDGEPVGDFYASSQPIEYMVNTRITNLYINSNIVLSDRIVAVDLWLTASDLPLVPEIFPELFVKKADGNIYWKSDESRAEFYNIFMSDDYVKLPPKLRALRETYDMIKDTLIINEK